MAGDLHHANWRPMTAQDLDSVVAIADMVHPGFPEDPEVLRERLVLHQDGCFILHDPVGNEPLGYLLSHPWAADSAPRLNTLIGKLPRAEVYYLHDIALLPAARGMRAGEKAVALVEAQARALGLKHIALVAVNESGSFWLRQGFNPVEDNNWLAKLASYGPDAAYMIKRLDG